MIFPRPEDLRRLHPTPLSDESRFDLIEEHQKLLNGTWAMVKQYEWDAMQILAKKIIAIENTKMGTIQRMAAVKDAMDYCRSIKLSSKKTGRLIENLLRMRKIATLLRR